MAIFESIELEVDLILVKSQSPLSPSSCTCDELGLLALLHEPYQQLAPPLLFLSQIAMPTASNFVQRDG